MIDGYPDRLQRLAEVVVNHWRAPDQPGDGGQGASATETLSYIYEIIRELKQLADKTGYRMSAILGAALVEAHIQGGERER